MSSNQGIPPTRTAIADSGGTASRPWYLYFQNIQTTLASQQAQIDALVPSGGGGGGMPITSNVIGQNSVVSQGVLANGIVTLTLANDVATATPTSRYGADSSGNKGWSTVASDFADSANVAHSAAPTTGIVSFDLTDVTLTTGGTLQLTNFDSKGRLSQHGVATTDNLPEGVTNLYYTDTRVYTKAKAIIKAGANITVTANDPLQTITIASTASGGVTSITAGTGLSASPSNPITGSGTLALATRAASTLMGNPTASAATPTDITIGTGLSLSVGGVLSATSVSPTQTINASENITAPAMVHIHTTGGATTVRNASAVSSARPARGFILTSVLSGNPAAVYGPGQVITGFPAATLTGDNVYLATTSAGAPSNTPALASGNLLQRVGTPISDTSFIFDPDDGIVMP